MLDISAIPQNTVVFLPAGQLLEMINTVVGNKLQEKQQLDLQKKELSKKEAAKLLSVSEGTVDNWSEAGILTKHYRGRLTYFLYSEIISSKTALKKYSRKTAIN